jgi:hypothetical protein
MSALNVVIWHPNERVYGPIRTYNEFQQAAEHDPRFQVLHDQIIALAEESGPLGLLMDRLERDSHA